MESNRGGIVKLQTFIVAQGPIVHQVNGLFAGIGILAGGVNAQGAAPFTVLVSIVDYRSKSPIVCTVEFRRGSMVLGRASASNNLVTDCPNHIFCLSLQAPIFEPGSYSFVAVIDGNEFVYPLPVGETSAPVVNGKVN